MTIEKKKIMSSESNGNKSNEDKSKMPDIPDVVKAEESPPGQVRSGANKLWINAYDPIAPKNANMFWVPLNTPLYIAKSLDYNDPRRKFALHPKTKNKHPFLPQRLKSAPPLVKPLQAVKVAVSKDQIKKAHELKLKSKKYLIERNAYLKAKAEFQVAKARMEKLMGILSPDEITSLQQKLKITERQEEECRQKQQEFKDAKEKNTAALQEARVALDAARQQKQASYTTGDQIQISLANTQISTYTAYVQKLDAYNLKLQGHLNLLDQAYICIIKEKERLHKKIKESIETRIHYKGTEDLQQATIDLNECKNRVKFLQEKIAETDKNIKICEDLTGPSDTSALKGGSTNDGGHLTIKYPHCDTLSSSCLSIDRANHEVNQMENLDKTVEERVKKERLKVAQQNLPKLQVQMKEYEELLNQADTDRKNAEKKLTEIKAQQEEYCEKNKDAETGLICSSGLLDSEMERIQDKLLSDTDSNMGCVTYSPDNKVTVTGEAPTETWKVIKNATEVASRTQTSSIITTGLHLTDFKDKPQEEQSITVQYSNDASAVKITRSFENNQYVLKVGDEDTPEKDITGYVNFTPDDDTMKEDDKKKIIVRVVQVDKERTTAFAKLRGYARSVVNTVSFGTAANETNGLTCMEVGTFGQNPDDKEYYIIDGFKSFRRKNESFDDVGISFRYCKGKLKYVCAAKLIAGFLPHGWAVSIPSDKTQPRWIGKWHLGSMSEGTVYVPGQSKLPNYSFYVHGVKGEAKKFSAAAEVAIIIKECSDIQKTLDYHQLALLEAYGQYCLQHKEELNNSKYTNATNDDAHKNVASAYEKLEEEKKRLTTETSAYGSELKYPYSEKVLLGGTSTNTDNTDIDTMYKCAQHMYKLCGGHQTKELAEAHIQAGMLLKNIALNLEQDRMHFLQGGKNHNHALNEFANRQQTLSDFKFAAISSLKGGKHRQVLGGKVADALQQCYL